MEVFAASSWTVKSYKSLSGQSGKVWSNEYEFIKREAEELDYNDFFNATLSLVAFEKAIHLNIVQIDRVVWSTWLPDYQEGQNNNFVGFNFGSLFKGDRVKDGPDEHVPLTHTARIDKSVVYGRSGHAFYRGVNTEAMLMAPNAGEYQWNPDNPAFTAFQEDFQDAETLNMNKFYQAGDAPFIMSLINTVPPSTVVFRNVTTMQLSKPVVLKKDHRYFDRIPNIGS